jgi:hypothetical protein
MVAMNSIPQQEVANGKGQMEFLRASPTTLLSEVAKKPSPMCPSGNSAMLRSASSGFCIKLYDTGRGMIQPIYGYDDEASLIIDLIIPPNSMHPCE